MVNNGGPYNISPPNLKPLQRTEAQKKYFFLDGKLYKKLRQDRARDVLWAWDFEEEKTVVMILSDAKRKMENAYDTLEVSQLVNRSRSSVLIALMDSKIAKPKMINIKSYPNSWGKQWGQYKWSKEDILGLHEHLLNVGAGRPRKDGTLYSGTRLPTRGELLAMLRNQPAFYMKTSDGEMVPVWSAYNEV
jgi:hypothetical protein